MDPSNADSVSLGGSSNNITVRSCEADSLGKSRSLPHPKYGPYQCPRCGESFGISPVFAAHMRSHYKSDREDRKRRRVEAKRRSYCAKRCQAAGGSNIRDNSTHESDEARVETQARNAHMHVKTENVVEQEKEMENVQGIGTAQGNLKIKEKPVM